MLARYTFIPLILVLALSAGIAKGQTYYYINSIQVEPAEPTTAHQISISLVGDLSSTGSLITSVSHIIMGNTVHLTVNAASGGGLSVLVPHTEVIDIGQLPAGTYSILVDGIATADLAPENQHSFVVSEAGGANCEDLTIASIQWATFTDTAIMVHVLNEEVGFDYPGFILFDANGDTLASEVVNLFAIGMDSWHTLVLHPDAEIPNGEFTGTLELWTGFYTDLACTWQRPIDLCPATECVTVHPYIGNFGGALVSGTFQWSISDENGPVASGTFNLSGEDQSDMADVCLPLGGYELLVIPPLEPTGGQLVMGVGGEDWGADVQQPLPQMMPFTPMPFTVVPACSNGTNGIEQGSADAPLLDIRPVGAGVDVRSLDGSVLGPVEVRDALGRLVFTTNATSDRLRIELPAFGPYFIQAREQMAKFFAGGN